MAEETRPSDSSPTTATVEATKLPLPKQQEVADFYNRISIQVGVAGLIGANFLTNIVEKEVDPKGVDYVEIFEALNLFYNIAFTIELAINIYGHWWCEFWRSGWNIFDAVVVAIGVINMLELPLPPAFSLLRMMRAFRVFRLFKRVKSLNKIIVSIVHSIPGVSNAFLILGIVMAIYSILAVEFYTHMAEDCQEDSGDRRFITPRGKCVGPEYFGTFSRSFYTFFQVLTGESWSEMVARPSIWYYYDDPLRAAAGSFFFVTYVLVTGFMLINVVVAVLLDKMSSQEEQEEEEPEAATTEAVKEEASKSPDNGNAAGSSAHSCQQQLHAVQEKVAALVEDRQRIRADLDTFTTDLADMKEKLNRILQLVST